MANEKNKGVPVTLAGRGFVVEKIPMVRVKRLGNVISGVMKDLSGLDYETDDKAAQAVLNKLLDFPYEILSLFITKLPKDIFEDEENGVTFPEFLEAMQEAIKLNRLDTLKNFLAPLMGMMANQSPTGS